MILLIDNYDSFSYNLYQLIGEIDPDIQVVRNDEMTVEEIEPLAPRAHDPLPGPRKTGGRGHLRGSDPRADRRDSDLRRLPRAIRPSVRFSVARSAYAKELMHGKQLPGKINPPDSLLFQGLPETVPGSQVPFTGRRGSRRSRRMLKVTADHR